MALRSIRELGDPVLNKKCKSDFDFFFFAL